MKKKSFLLSYSVFMLIKVYFQSAALAGEYQEKQDE